MPQKTVDSEHIEIGWIVSMVLISLLLVVVIVLLIRSYRRERQRIKVLHIAQQDIFDPDDSSIPVQSRVSAWNLFWDLGADSRALDFVRTYGLLNHPENYDPEKIAQLRDLLEHTGSYDAFLNSIIPYVQKHNFHNISQSHDNNFEHLHEQIEQAVVEAHKFRPPEITAEDFAKSVRSQLLPAVGEMFGLEELDLDEGSGALKRVPNAAMRFYRINANHLSSNLIFRTAEDLGSELAAGMAGRGAGFTVGSIVGEAIAFDIDGDGMVDGWETTLISLGLGLIGSVVSGDLFKGIAKWWKLRHLRKAKENLDEASTNLAKYVLHTNRGEFRKNLQLPILYWKAKLKNTSAIEAEEDLSSKDERWTIGQVVVDEAIRTEQRIISELSRQQNRLVSHLNQLEKNNQTHDAGRVLVAHREYLLQGIPQIEVFLEQYFKRFNVVLGEAKTAKAKGLL